MAGSYRNLLVWICLIVVQYLQTGDGAKILGIFPLPGRSHFTVHSALVTELAKRGHQLTVVSPFPEKSPPPNYKDIVIQASRENFLNKTGGFLGFSDKMNFWERLINTVAITLQKVTRNLLFVHEQQRILEKHFGKFGPLPSINELQASTSLMFVNHHFSIGYPRPLLPNVVEVGGMHIKPPKKLPEDLQKYLDDAKDGVIYFSFGSQFYSSDLPESKIKSFLKVFQQLKQRILWKWEKDSPLELSKNVKLEKWFPQSDILAHPNVKLFISHCGLLSAQETSHHGVPVVAIPLAADQRLNAETIISLGYGVKVDYANITTESLTWAIKEVLENTRYSENAQRISKIYRDQPQTPLEKAVFWTEYVIRHKGAPHMRSAALDLNFFQYFLLDVIAVLALALVLIISIPLIILRALYKKCCGNGKTEAKISTKKKMK